VRLQLENSQSPARQPQNGIQSPISQLSDLDTSGDLSSAGNTSTELFYASDISGNISSPCGTAEELSSAGDTSRDLSSATDTSFASDSPEDLHFGGENSSRQLQEETDSYCSAISWFPDQSLTFANESGDRSSSTDKVSRLTRPIVMGGEKIRDEPGRADERGDERAEKRMTRKPSDRSTTCTSPGASAGLAGSDQEPVC
jgi:hypothetical protein